MSIFNMIYGSSSGSGGDASLNFSIVAQADQPTSPTENMIWVETSAEMTGWVLSATAPVSPVEGMVWISTGTSSLFSFNALGDAKNTLMVYPLNVSQYNNGAWVSVAAMSYINGEWVDWWNGEYYLPGNMFDNLTGGWKIVSGTGMDTGFTDSGIVFESIASTERQASAYTNQKIDVSDYTKMLVTVNVETVGNGFTFGLSSDNTKQGASFAYSKKQSSVTSGAVELELDISSVSGEYYLAMYAYACDCVVTKVVLFKPERVFLFDNGNQYEAITGGWEQNSAFIYSSGNTAMGTVTIGDTLKCVCSSGKTSYAVTKNKIDVTDYSTLNVTVTSKGRKVYELALMAEPGNVQNSNAAYIPLSNYENSMDISTISGSYYVLVGSAGDGTVEATKVWLEK